MLHPKNALAGHGKSIWQVNFLAGQFGSKMKNPCKIKLVDLPKHLPKHLFFWQVTIKHHTLPPPLGGQVILAGQKFSKNYKKIFSPRPRFSTTCLHLVRY